MAASSSTLPKEASSNSSNKQHVIEEIKKFIHNLPSTLKNEKDWFFWLADLGFWAHLARKISNCYKNSDRQLYFEWLQKCDLFNGASLDDCLSDAKLELALCYTQGKITEVDYEKALPLYADAVRFLPHHHVPRESKKIDEYIHSLSSIAKKAPPPFCFEACRLLIDCCTKYPEVKDTPVASVLMCIDTVFNKKADLRSEIKIFLSHVLSSSSKLKLPGILLLIDKFFEYLNGEAFPYMQQLVRQLEKDWLTIKFDTRSQNVLLQTCQNVVDRYLDEIPIGAEVKQTEGGLPAFYAANYLQQYYWKQNSIAHSSLNLQLALEYHRKYWSLIGFNEEWQKLQTDSPDPKKKQRDFIFKHTIFRNNGPFFTEDISKTLCCLYVDKMSVSEILRCEQASAVCNATICMFYGLSLTLHTNQLKRAIEVFGGACDYLSKVGLSNHEPIQYLKRFYLMHEKKSDCSTKILYFKTMAKHSSSYENTDYFKKAYEAAIEMKTERKMESEEKKEEKEEIIDVDSVIRNCQTEYAESLTRSATMELTLTRLTRDPLKMILFAVNELKYPLAGIYFMETEQLIGRKLSYNQSELIADTVVMLKNYPDLNLIKRIVPLAFREEKKETISSLYNSKNILFDTLYPFIINGKIKPDDLSPTVIQKMRLSRPEFRHKLCLAYLAKDGEYLKIHVARHYFLAYLFLARLLQKVIDSSKRRATALYIQIWFCAEEGIGLEHISPEQQEIIKKEAENYLNSRVNESFTFLFKDASRAQMLATWWKNKLPPLLSGKSVIEIINLTLENEKDISTKLMLKEVRTIFTEAIEECRAKSFPENTEPDEASCPAPLLSIIKPSAPPEDALVVLTNPEPTAPPLTPSKSTATLFHSSEPSNTQEKKSLSISEEKEIENPADFLNFIQKNWECDNDIQRFILLCENLLKHAQEKDQHDFVINYVPTINALLDKAIEKIDKENFPNKQFFISELDSLNDGWINLYADVYGYKNQNRLGR